MALSDDNTGVLRMKKDFEDFLSSSALKQPSRLAFDSSTAGFESSFQKSQLHRNENKEARSKAELLAAKSQIVDLESKVNSLETSRKRARIEYEMEMENVKQGFQREIDRYGEFRHKMQTLLNKEEDMQEQLKSYKEEVETLRLSNSSLQNDNKQLNTELRELEFSMQQMSTENGRISMKQETELSICKTELEDTEKQLQHELKRNHDLHEQMKGLEEQKMRALASECKVKELEEKLSRLDEDALIAKTMRARVAQFPELEKENKALKEEIRYLKNKQENLFLLKEEIKGLQKKLERAEQRVTEYNQFQTQNELLQKRLKAWEIVDENGKLLARHPEEMKQRVAELQTNNVLLLEKQGKLQASVHSMESHLDFLKDELEQTKYKATQEHQRFQQYEDVNKRLKRKLLLVSKERDGFKKILDSYESEATVNIGQVTNDRVRQLEEVIEGYHKQIEDLEQHLDRKSEQHMEVSLHSQTLERQLSSHSEVKTVPVSSEVDKKIIADLRKQVEEQQSKLDSILEEKEILEARIDQRHMQGEYDPTKVKVLHFKMNPSDLAQKRRALELTQLQEENKKLKERIKILEESGSQAQDVTLQVENKLKEPGNTKELEKLKSQLQSSELKNKRLTEAFVKKAQEFREGCYQLLGFKMDLPTENQYRLMSMYAEQPNEYIMFQQSSNGEVMLLETEYSQTLTDKIETYLQNYNSIPAFLSSITLDLLSRQTMIG